MLYTIFLKEYKSLRRDGRLRFAAGVVLALFALALATGAAYYRTTNAAYAEAQARTYEQWLEQGEKNPHAAAHYGLYAFKPVPLLAVVDKGLDDYLGSAVWLEAHNQNEVKLRPVQDGGALARYGALTVGFVWQYLVPLAILLLGFDAVSREYEAGTLRMVLSTRAGARRLAAGKAVALFASVLAWVALPMFFVATAALWFVGGTAAFGEAMPAWTLMLAFYAGFYLLLALLTVAVSTALRTSGAALVALLGGWAIGVFLVPRLGGTVAELRYPTPSALEFSENVLREREKGEDGTGSYAAFQREVEEEAKREYGVDSLEQLPVSFAGLALQAGEERDWKVYDKHYGALAAVLRDQHAVLAGFNWLSPPLAMRDLSRALAGTDHDKHLDFTEKAEAHRRLAQEILNRDQLQNGVGRERGYQAGAALWQQVPAFEYRAPDVGFALQHQIRSLLALALWLGLALGSVWYTAGRLRP